MCTSLVTASHVHDTMFQLHAVCTETTSSEVRGEGKSKGLQEGDRRGADELMAVWNTNRKNKV